MSEEAIKARAKAAETSLPADLKQSLKIDEDANGDESGASAYDELGKWIEEQAKDAGGVSKVKDVDIYLKAKDLGIESKHRTPAVLAQCLFDDNIVKQLPDRASLLRKMTSIGDKHEKAFLGGIERFVGIDRPNLIATISLILHAIYDEDIVTED
ncbi:eukaryotic translation initiation factor 5, partial [Teratosphaeriaceae sp. CCFEE 6253]